MARKAESQGRILASTEIKTKLGVFTLLNSEKLGRVMDVLGGVTEASGDDATALAACKKLPKGNAILALYDRLGGAIKLGARKVSTGTFYNFAEKAPVDKPEIAEEDFADEMVLVPKKSNKAKKQESTADRVARFKGAGGNVSGKEAPAKKAKAKKAK